METLLIRATETMLLLAAVLTLGAGLGGLVGYLAMRTPTRKRKLAKDRLHYDVDLHREICRAVMHDRSARSRKGWQTRKSERRAQQDADINLLLRMP